MRADGLGHERETGSHRCLWRLLDSYAFNMYIRAVKKEYDFSGGKRGAVVPSPGKTRITIMLDNDVLEYFRDRAESQGMGYQTLINAALKGTIDHARIGEEPLTVAKLREILRQELHAA